MAVIRDVMASFELLQPASIADAQKLLQQHGEDAWVMAGGMDTFDWLKDRIRKPKVVVDLSGIEELKGPSSGRSIVSSWRPPNWLLRHRSGIRAPSGEMYRRTRAAGITGRVGRVTERAEIFAMPTHPPAATASMRFFTLSDAWR